jgi:hypothetical protein
MPVFNNPVLYDQHLQRNSIASIVPELAKSYNGWRMEDV